ncbi:MAG: TetR-like C-terminal domain-containing protein [Actinomycetota bacterium]
MATQVGLDRAGVIAAAAEIADEEGLAALTLAALAQRLGIRSQSLYAHVDGLDGLHRGLALHGIRLIHDDLRDAVVGRSGRDALHAIAVAHVTFARCHPGVYEATVGRSRDDELLAALTRAAEPFERVIQSFGVDGDDVAHAHRAFWSAIHGFVALEAAGLTRGPVSSRETVRRIVAMFADALEHDGGSLRPVTHHSSR